MASATHVAPSIGVVFSSDVSFWQLQLQCVSVIPQLMPHPRQVAPSIGVAFSGDVAFAAHVAPTNGVPTTS